MVQAMDSTEGRASSHRSLFEEILLEESLGQGRFSTFSRSVFHEERLVGHVSARLVAVGKAEQIRESNDIHAYEDVRLQGRLRDSDLSHLNRKGPGSVLVLNSLFWDEDHLGLMGAFHVPRMAIDRIVRYFEGNYVRGFETIIIGKFRPLAGPFVAAAEGGCDIQSFGKGHCKLSVRGPWRRKGIFLDWGERLFTERPDYSDTDHLSVRRRHQGRVLHEFGFDVDATWAAGLLPGWNRKAQGELPSLDETVEKEPAKAKTQEKYPGLLTFRNAVNEKYKDDVRNDSGRAELTRIAALFGSRPSIMTP